jgi:hypothetical protein
VGSDKFNPVSQTGLRVKEAKSRSFPYTVTTPNKEQYKCRNLDEAIEAFMFLEDERLREKEEVDLSSEQV